jgi:hypothetical protein
MSGIQGHSNREQMCVPLIRCIASLALIDYVGTELFAVLTKARDPMAADEYPLATRVLQFQELRHHVKLTCAEKRSSAFEQHVPIYVRPLRVARAVNVVPFRDVHLGLGLWLSRLLRYVAFSKHIRCLR